VKPLNNRLVGSAHDPRGKRFSRDAILLIKGQELAKDGRDGAGRHRKNLAPETHAVRIHFSAEQLLIVWGLLVANFTHVAVKADVGDVMMPARIGAATNLDAEFLNFRIVVAFQLAGKHVGQRE